jgi:hypothetical protein
VFGTIARAVEEVRDAVANQAQERIRIDDDAAQRRPRASASARRRRPAR